VFGFQFSVFGFRFSIFGFRFSVFGFRFSVFGFRFSVFGVRFSVCGFRFLFKFLVFGFSPLPLLVCNDTLQLQLSEAFLQQSSLSIIRSYPARVLGGSP
jgi:hypothetical protein